LETKKSTPIKILSFHFAAGKMKIAILGGNKQAYTRLFGQYINNIKLGTVGNILSAVKL
jgi:hypothetical protein